MSRRVNVMLDDQVWQQLQAIPTGERSRLINESLAAELLRRQRIEAIEGMDALRRTMKAVPGSSEDWIRADRESH